MTAVVGILNKSSVAIAADSAVTVGGSKIYNTANKIFTLSKKHPVGIAIYSSASFMDMPWEILIKTYRNQLGGRNFDTLVEYKDDFFKYLMDNLSKISPQKNQENNLFRLCLNFFNSMKQTALNAVSDALNTVTSIDEQKRILTNAIVVEIGRIHQNLSSHTVFCPNFQNFDYKAFIQQKEDLINQAKDKVFGGINLTTIQLERLHELIGLYSKINQIFNGIENLTGLVFVGYGETEYYPSCEAVNVGQVIDNRIRLVQQTSVEISDDNPASILPFAQVDVINSFIMGIDNDLQQAYIQSFNGLFHQFRDDIAKLIAQQNAPLAQQISGINLDNIIKVFESQNNEIINNKHVHPTLMSVATLSKEDLAEMAESLIYLTYLKRRISFAQESVGGPVDVAVISKGDGFVWIKRKHYFKPDLNHQFFQNYNKTL